MTTLSQSPKQHRRGFSVSSILSYLSGTQGDTTSPIKQVRAAKDDDERVSEEQRLPKIDYPHQDSFLVDRLVHSEDIQPLERSISTTVSAMREGLSERITKSMTAQATLVYEMKNVDNLTKEALSTVNTRVRKTEKHVNMLEGIDKLSTLAEKTYAQVQNMIQLLQEIDSLLPHEERIKHHKSHYNNLAMLINEQDDMPELELGRQRRIVSTPAISSLRSIQESSPRPSDKGARKTSSFVAAPTSRSASAAEEDSGTTVDTLPPMRIRLAPRKSKSNLRVPQLRTVPPLPTTQHSAVLPTVERDNMSTRTSIASHRSIFSTISKFWSGQSVRTVQNDTAISRAPKTAEETLRKISGASTLSGRRQVSGARSNLSRHAS